MTGLDLVELQLRIAAGERVDTAVTRQGHAIEARLYAEDPRTFLPQAGRLERLSFPDGIRVDAGVAEGDEVGVSYDPMIAKLIAHGESRAEALDRLTEALDATVAEGVTTNLPFLRWLVRHPAFVAADLSTAFLTDQPPLSAPPRRLPTGPFAAAWRLNLPVPPAPCRHQTSTRRHRRARAREAVACAPRCPARSPRSRSQRATPSARGSRSSCWRR